MHTGTLTTERIISEIQGKTNHFQSLDAQPTYLDILNRISLVESNKQGEESLEIQGVKIPESSHRRRLSRPYRNSETTDTDRKIPKSFSEFKVKLKEADKEGKEDAKTLFKQYLPKEFCECLEKVKVSDEHTAMEMPYLFDCCNASVIDDVPDKSFNLLHYDCTLGGTSVSESDQDMSSDDDENDDSIGNNADNEVGDEKQSEESSSEHNDQFDASLHSEDMQSRSGKDKWYISRKVGSEIQNEHVAKMLRYLIPREYISRERSKRHISSEFIPGAEPLPIGHDVIKFRDYAVKSSTTKRLDLMRIIILERKNNKPDKSISSCKRTDKDVRFRGRLFVKESNGYWSVSSDILISNLRCVKDILLEVVFKSKGDGMFVLSNDTKSRIEQKGYNSDTLIMPTCTSDHSGSEKEANEDDGHIGDGYYVLRDISAPRWNSKTHTKEYKASFLGYDSDEDVWLPESEFLEPMPVTSVSSRGRRIIHKTKENVCRNTTKVSSEKRRTQKKKASDICRGKYIVMFFENTINDQGKT